MRVLLIEDEDRLRQALSRGLRAEGHEVLGASDGEAGLRLARDDRLDVVVCDILIPKVNGFQVCKQLRSEGIWTPILMLTAKDGEWDEAEALDAGADGYLTKPFSYVVLGAHLRALARRGAAAPGGGREHEDALACASMGYLHCGPNGAGHFVKMVHNGIEYGLMAAYAEGLNLLQHADAGLKQGQVDAETAPLSDPRLFQFKLDVAAIAEVWRHGSIISSRLLDLTAQALAQDPALGSFGGRVSDSGEGRWTVQAAVEIGVPAHVLSAALYSRFESRGRAEFADKLLSAMRLGFGGHLEKKA